MSGVISNLELKAWVKNPNRSPKRKLFVGDGLFLTITNAGTAVWRVRYRIGSKDRIYSIGPFEKIGLKDARLACDKARALIREGQDPVANRRFTRVANIAQGHNTFGDCAEQWLRKRNDGWRPSYQKTVRLQLDNHVLPHLGRIPIQEINDPIISHIIERLDDRPVTAKKVRQYIEKIFDLAKALGKFTGQNPAISAKEMIPRSGLGGRRAAFLTWAELGEVLRKAETVNLTAAVRMAHRLCAFTAARIGNVIAADWSEFNLDAETPTWTIPREKMKAHERHFPHKIVLGSQIAEELRAWKSLTGASAGFVFPAVAGDRPHISSEAISKAYRVTMGLADKHSPHGWRAAFATLARDNDHPRDAVELALDHIHDNQVARAYDRGERLEERVKLAEWWSSKLMKAQRGEL